MCGRLSQSRYQDYLHLCEVGEGGRPVRILPPRFNVAPSLELYACRLRADGTRELVPLVWGLVPHWVKDPAKVSHPINARVETVREKPMFREAFERRRCLVPADGFYEWRREGKKKQPWFIRLRSGEPMAFAGLWERRERPDGAPLETCTLLVGPANELIAPLHDRMPILIHREDFTRWLSGEGARVTDLLQPCPADELVAWPVSEAVNNARSEGAALIEPLPTSPDDLPLFDA